MWRRLQNQLIAIFIALLTTILVFDSAFAAQTNSNGGVTQKEAQQQTKQENEKGAQIAKILGVATVALGTAQIYQGYTQITTGRAMQSNPYTAAAGAAMVTQGQIGVATGTITTLSGLQGLLAAKKMAANAALAGKNMAQIDSLSKNADDNIKIDPSFLKNGDVGKVLDDFEKATGIPRDGLLNALNKGVDPFDLLAAKGIPKSLLDEANTKGHEAFANGAKPDLEKYGLSAEKIAEGMGIGDLSGGGMMASAKPGSSGLDDLLGGLTKDSDADIQTGGVDPNKIGLNPEVQKALDKAGVTDKTLFQMVSMRYRARTPALFGLKDVQLDDRKPANAETDREGTL